MVIATNLTSLLLLLGEIGKKNPTHIEERSVHTNSEICNIQLGSLKNLFNSKQINQIVQPLIRGVRGGGGPCGGPTCPPPLCVHPYKKYFKISLLPSKKVLINTAFSVNISLISLFIIIQYVSSRSYENIDIFKETFSSVFFTN